MNIESYGRPPIVPPFPFCPSGANQAVDISHCGFTLEHYQTGAASADFVAFNGVFRGIPGSDNVSTDYASCYVDPARQDDHDIAILELAQLAATRPDIRQQIARKICGRVSNCIGSIRAAQGSDACGALNGPSLDGVLQEVAIEIGLLDDPKI